MNPEAPYEPDDPRRPRPPKNVCPIEMYNHRFCGRALHTSPNDPDNTPICLMHSNDPKKDKEKFQLEFDRILQQPDVVVDCTAFVFPAVVSVISQHFQVECLFAGAKFTSDVTFYLSRFTRGADFSRVVFAGNADFRNAEFRGSNFIDTVFLQRSEFDYALFHSIPQFQNARFLGSVSFTGTKFRSWSNFVSTTFVEDVNFNEAEFADVVNFRFARFGRRVDFRETRFHEGGETTAKALSPSLILTLSFFEQPEKVTFYRTYLGQALLHNCNVSKLLFSDVRWLCRTLKRKSMVFDEIVDLEDNHAKDLRPANGDSNDRNYAVIAEVYQQLQKNYDDRGDYWTAGNFHYGDMEMKRLASQRHNGVARWLHSNLGLVAWYRYASEYGESYSRVGWWLLLIVAVFTLLYPLAGLRHVHQPSTPQIGHVDPREVVTYARPFRQDIDAPRSWQRAEIYLVGNSLMTTLYVAAFQKDLEYEPSYPWGRILALLEVLLTSTFIALYLLAVRRQFRR